MEQRKRPPALQQLLQQPPAPIAAATPTMPTLPSPAVAPPRGSSTPPRRRPGGIAPAVRQLSLIRLPTPAPALASSAGTPDPRPKDPTALTSTGEDEFISSVLTGKPGIPDENDEEEGDDDEGARLIGGAGETEPMWRHIDSVSRAELNDLVHPPRIRILSAVITRPVLEGDHVEYEIETRFSLSLGHDAGSEPPAAAAAVATAAAAAANDGDAEGFMECEKFDGLRQGYEFKSDQQGVGYYRTVTVGTEAAAAAAANGEDDNDEEGEVHFTMVMRRFSKFDALRKLIIKKFPGLPKMPKKGFRCEAATIIDGPTRDRFQHTARLFASTLVDDVVSLV